MMEENAVIPKSPSVPGIGLGGFPKVFVNDAAQHLPALHRTIGLCSRRGNRCLLLDALMGAGPVVMSYIFVHDPSQVLFMITSSLSRHSSRIVLTQRSAKALAFGA